jgi:uncharacterized protein YuzE
LIAPLEVRHDTVVDVLYIAYTEGTFSHTEAVDPDGEVLADIAVDGRVLGIECLTIDPPQRRALAAFASRNDLRLPTEVDTFQRCRRS